MLLSSKYFLICYIQDFRDQDLAMKKVCNVLDLHIGRCESDARELLKKKNVTNPTNAQLNKAMDISEEETHAIIFMYKADRQKYGNILDQMENDILQKKDPFPKTISEASKLRAGWKHKAVNNKYNEAIDGMAFATDGKEEKAGNKHNKKKDIMCFKCGKKGHYSNECDEAQMSNRKTAIASNKSGSNFLMMNDNQHGHSSDEENTEEPYANYDFSAIQEANDEHEEDNTSGNEDIENEPSDDSYAEEHDEDKCKGFAFLHDEVVCSTQDKAGIPRKWILLDSQSVDEFSNPNLLTNIHDAKTVITLHCNAGKARAN